MIKLGEIQELYIVRKADFGVYLNDTMGDNLGSILLPKKQVPENAAIDDAIEVFVYKDSDDRPIATTTIPYITLNQLAALEVKEVTDIGAFLDWGLEKDLLLPFNEQTMKPREGDKYLVKLYIDKTERLCASMKVYHSLTTEHSYEKNDWVDGIVYSVNPEMGVFVAVDNQYFGMIAKSELRKKLYIGNQVHVRVTKVREDGKLDLTFHKPIQEQMDADAQLVLDAIESYDGTLPFTDKASPSVIDHELGLSKNAFKRAVGRLLKQDMILMENGTIRRK